MPPSLAIAERRDIAALSAPFPAYGESFWETCEENNALPRILSSVDAAAEELEISVPLDAQVMTEYNAFYTAWSVHSSTLAASEGERQCPGKYWLRIRDDYPRVGAIMLWWLTPACFIGLEGGFSKVSMLASMTRRRNLRMETRRAVVRHAARGLGGAGARACGAAEVAGLCGACACVGGAVERV